MRGDRKAAHDNGAWDELAALLAVSRVVHEGRDLNDTLDTIAEQATRVAHAASAGVLLVESHRTLRLAGSHGLTPEYESFLSSLFIVEGKGQAGLALKEQRITTIEDMDADLPRQRDTEAWRRFAAIQGYRAMAAVPLTFQGDTLGVLTVYRAHTGPWPDSQVALLRAFGEHAAGAIATARLLALRARHVAALTRVVGALREQTHEYANHLHAVHGLLALGDFASASEFVEDLTELHHRVHSATIDHLDNPIVAALVLAELNIARQRGIDLQLDESSSLGELPPRLSAAEAVTIMGNLLDNALDAVERMAPERRRVILRIDDDGDAVTIAVRDFGAGLPVTAHTHLFRRGFTSKDGHAGVGLALVAAAVTAAQGTIRIERCDPGTLFEVVIPRT